MNYYSDENRGVFQNKEKASQLISFEGMKFVGRGGVENVTPTDVDGLVQLDNENCLIIYELKYSGDMSEGQADALKFLCDKVQKSGTDAVLMLAIHGTPCTEMIIAKDAIVKKVYMNGRWHNASKGNTLKEATDGYIKFIQEKRETRKEKDT